MNITVARLISVEAKGDHKHIGDLETPYSFTTPATLIADFWRDVDLLKEPK